MRASQRLCLHSSNRAQDPDNWTKFDQHVQNALFADLIISILWFHYLAVNFGHRQEERAFRMKHVLIWMRLNLLRNRRHTKTSSSIVVKRVGRWSKAQRSSIEGEVIRVGNWSTGLTRRQQQLVRYTTSQSDKAATAFPTLFNSD